MSSSAQRPEDDDKQLARLQQEYANGNGGRIGIELSRTWQAIWHMARAEDWSPLKTIIPAGVLLVRAGLVVAVAMVVGVIAVLIGLIDAVGYAPLFFGIAAVLVAAAWIFVAQHLFHRY